jgi:hypothetical protein
MHVFVKAGVALFLAAEVLIVAAVGDDGLWLAGAWAIVAGGVTVVAVLVRNSTARVALAAALVAACVLFAVELGVFFVPAAGALLAAAVVEQHHRTPRHKTPLHAGR